MIALSLFRSNVTFSKLIQINSYPFFNAVSNATQHWNYYNIQCIISNEYTQNDPLDIIEDKQNNDTLRTIFSEGILFKRGPGTSARKHSKCKTKKRMARVGFLARISTYNGRKIILRQRRKGRRYLGAKL